MVVRLNKAAKSADIRAFSFFPFNSFSFLDGCSVGRKDANDKKLLIQRKP